MPNILMQLYEEAKRNDGGQKYIQIKPKCTAQMLEQFGHHTQELCLPLIQLWQQTDFLFWE